MDKKEMDAIVKKAKMEEKFKRIARVKQVEAHISALRTLIEFIPKAIEVLAPWDGKVTNQVFKDAIKELNITNPNGGSPLWLYISGYSYSCTKETVDGVEVKDTYRLHYDDSTHRVLANKYERVWNEEKKTFEEKVVEYGIKSDYYHKYEFNIYTAFNGKTDRYAHAYTAQKMLECIPRFEKTIEELTPYASIGALEDRLSEFNDAVKALNSIIDATPHMVNSILGIKSKYYI